MGLLKVLSNKFYVAIMKCLNDRAPKIQSYKRKLTAGATRTGVIKQGTTLICPKYKKYYFCDKETGEGYFFRCKPIKDKGKYPVVIYHHGNGWNRGGMNNIQMWEFNMLRSKLNKQKCHQVVIHLDVTCEYNRDGHSRALNGFVEYIQRTYKNVDFDRIYLVGTSHGGYGCVYEVLRNPNKYAAAVISMSYTYNENNVPPEEFQVNPYVRCLTDMDYKTLANTPFYLSWAKDDHIVMVESNELLLKNLKENNANLQYKIYETGGHTIATKFFRNEPWDKWMFDRKRSDGKSETDI